MFEWCMGWESKTTLEPTLQIHTQPSQMLKPSARLLKPIQNPAQHIEKLSPSTFSIINARKPSLSTFSMRKLETRKVEKVGKPTFFNIFVLEGLKKVGFSNFFNFSERKSLGPRFLCGTVEKVEEVGKTNFFNIFGLEGLKKVGFPNFFNFSTKKSWPQRLSFRKVEKVGKTNFFQAFQAENAEKVGFSNFFDFSERVSGAKTSLWKN